MSAAAPPSPEHPPTCCDPDSAPSADRSLAAVPPDGVGSSVEATMASATAAPKLRTRAR